MNKLEMCLRTESGVLAFALEQGYRGGCPKSQGCWRACLQQPPKVHARGGVHAAAVGETAIQRPRRGTKTGCRLRRRQSPDGTETYADGRHTPQALSGDVNRGAATVGTMSLLF